MWWLTDPVRLKQEVAAIGALREQEAWLSAATPRLFEDLKFAFDFDLFVNDETFPFRLEYPALFPESPARIIPRDGRRLSNHQYGDGGELCLEFRSDNWDPSVSGAMMIESTYRLLSGERPARDERAVVPSAHFSSLGQELRGCSFRFLLTRALLVFGRELPTGSCRDCKIIEVAAPPKVWTAYVAEVGSTEAPEWRESAIPPRAYKGEQGVLLRVETLEGFPPDPDGAALDGLVARLRQPDLANPSDSTYRFIIMMDAVSARTFYSFSKDGERIVIPYKTIDFTDDHERRLSETYEILSQKKVGIVGGGSLGSKIAAGLARSGVAGFVLVDDDIMKPGNLVRHELDADSLGMHKVDALKMRLQAIAPNVQVSVRRVALGGQEASGTTASVLDELATCDLLIDATADPQAFNFVAGVARNALRPMIWAEVYSGGIGGFVARLRPNIEPPPHAARRQYLGWCREQAVPWSGHDHDYRGRGAGDRTLVADDGDVAVLAAHATRMTIDVLVRPGESLFPHPAYAIGLSREWIFDAPFDARPIDFVPEGEWQNPRSQARAEEAAEFMVSLIESSKRAG